MDSTDARDLMARLGRVVRRHRLAARLGQEEFADKVGMHRTTCSLIERGRQSPTVVMLARMAAALGTTMATLVGEAESLAPLAPDPPDIPPGRRARRDEGR